MKMSWPKERDSSDPSVGIHVAQRSRDPDCNMKITCLIRLSKYSIIEIM